MPKKRTVHRIKAGRWFVSEEAKRDARRFFLRKVSEDEYEMMVEEPES